MADFSTIKQVPFMPEGVGSDFDRAEERDFKIAGNMPCEIYVVTTSTAGAYTLPTSFSRVLGGWCYSVTDSETKPAVIINPVTASPQIADVTNLPTTAQTHVICIFGDK